MDNKEYGMICCLTHQTLPHQKTPLAIHPVTNTHTLADFLTILDTYDPYVHDFYRNMTFDHHKTHTLLQTDEQLFVGYDGSTPTTIGILFFHKKSAAIFSLITKKIARGKGYGTDMILFLMKVAQNKGCTTVTLSASSQEGYRIYERLGFGTVGLFECYEYKNFVSNKPYENSQDRYSAPP